MNLETAPVAMALFFIAALVLAGFTLYAHKAGKIQKRYTAISGGLLGVIFAILLMMITGDMRLASVLGIIIFGWFFAFSQIKASAPTPRATFSKQPRVR